MCDQELRFVLLLVFVLVFVLILGFWLPSQFRSWGSGWLFDSVFRSLDFDFGVSFLAQHRFESDHALLRQGR